MFHGKNRSFRHNNCPEFVSNGSDGDSFAASIYSCFTDGPAFARIASRRYIDVEQTTTRST